MNKFKLAIEATVCIFVCSSCALDPISALPDENTPTPSEDIVVQSAAPFDLFVPIEPITYVDWFEPPWEDLDGDGEFSTEERLYAFPNEAVQVRIKKFDANGSVTFPIVGVSVAGGNYQIVVDYAKYRTDRADDGYIYQSGVGIRLRANIVTRSAGIDISSLFGVALAAQTDQLTGTLRFETIGISGKLTSSLIPLPSEISIESISSAMQAAAAMKSNMYDDAEIQVVPQIFAFKAPTIDAKKIETDAAENESVNGEEG